MSEQPEAMRLANLLETDGWPDAAAELRGMHERIQLLYEQLNEAEKQLDAQYKLGMEAEREACAKLCEESGAGYVNEWNKKLGVADELEEVALECAHAIRARGQA